MASSTACETVKSWLRANALRLGLKELRFEHSEEPATFGAVYELPGYLIGVRAWDNASCLDIDVLEARSKTAQLLCAGPCAGDAELLARLQKLETWVAERPGI